MGNLPINGNLPIEAKGIPNIGWSKSQYRLQDLPVVGIAPVFALASIVCTYNHITVCPKIYLHKLSVQAQKFGISMKIGFIGRPWSVNPRFWKFFGTKQKCVSARLTLRGRVSRGLAVPKPKHFPSKGLLLICAPFFRPSDGTNLVPALPKYRLHCTSETVKYCQ